MAAKRKDYDSLSERARVEFTVSEIVSSVLNGGLCSYYYNSGAEHVYDCIEDLETLGAEEMLTLVKAFNKLFGKRVPVDFAGRAAAYSALLESAHACAEMERICEHEVAVAEVTRALLDAYLAGK